MKFNHIALMAGAVYFVANTSLSFAGVDMQQWEIFVRSELQSVVNQVDQTGKAPVSRPLVGDYDTNKDNFIDSTEVKAIKAYLGNSPQVQVPAVQEPAVQAPAVEKAVTAVEKTQPVSSHQSSAEKTSKKKEWWNN